MYGYKQYTMLKKVSHLVLRISYIHVMAGTSIFEAQAFAFTLVETVAKCSNFVTMCTITNIILNFVSYSEFQGFRS